MSEDEDPHPDPPPEYQGRGKSDWTARRLRWRRRARWGAVGCGVALGAAVLCDHAGVFGYTGDDRNVFERRACAVQRVEENGDVVVAGPGGGETVVCLIGVRGPTAEGRGELRQRLGGKTVVVNLAGPQTRDERGRLLAYLYLGDSEDVNLELVRQGEARSDRGRAHPLQAMFNAAEGDARKHGRGLWKK